MKNFKKYFRIRNYLEKMKWIRLFSNISKSSYGKNLKIHISSKVVNSTIKDNVDIGKNVIVGNSEIGNECKLLANSYFHKALLDDYSYVNMNSYILRAQIGKFCSIASNVYIGPGTHPMNFITTHPFVFLKKFGEFIPIDDEEIVNEREKKSIIIGNDVWIGQGSIIMDNIKIGDGAIVGAHAVVTKDVDPYAIVVGNPARVIRYRFNREIIKQLLDIEWWDWDKEKIKREVANFSTPKAFIKNCCDF